jgi:hypothetical protein
MEPEQTEPEPARVPWTEPVVQKLESSRAGFGGAVDVDGGDVSADLS